MLLMAAVILPGLVISAVGIYLVSQQKSARLVAVKQEFSERLNRLKNAIQSETRNRIEAVFSGLEARPVDWNRPESLQERIKSSILNYPIVKYPFFISSTRGFLFPLSRKADFPGVQSLAKDPGKIIKKPGVKKLYLEAYSLEYRERKLSTALKLYLSCLDAEPLPNSKPYILNAVGRCYFKLNRFRQAIHYYGGILNRFPELKKKDAFLYFTLLRQIAVCYNLISAAPPAVEWYLRLYEEVPRTPGPFAFFRNEALDFLNRHTPKTGRFTQAKARDKLEKASELDISLQWLYFDTAPGGDEPRFLRLRELYESNDEKVRFYKAIKPLTANNAVPGTTEQSVSIRTLPNPTGGNGFDVCLKAVLQNHPRYETVVFGFMPASAHIENVLVKQLATLEFNREDIRIQVRHTRKTAGSALPAVEMGELLSGKYLTLKAQRENFFETEVQREIRLYYVLLAALIITLGLGIFLFYKYLTREAELVRLKAAFVDSASHTLKTPLTRMSLLAENVARGWVSDETQKKEFFNSILSETARMSDTIDNMLNFSRIETGKQLYHPEKLDLREITSAMVERYRDYAKSLGFELETSISDELPFIKLDPKAAELIVGNLLQNAIKYSPDKKFIRVSVYSVKGNVILEVADRGMGIAEKHLSLLFKKFSRIPDDRVRAIEGSGLGLFLLHHAVSAHHGKIEVKSSPGQGTTFKVIFQ